MQTSTAARVFTVLGIETSCDETAAAVVRGSAPGPAEILSNVVFSQIEAHRPYGGVVPEIAARAHVEIIDTIVERALNESGLALSEMDVIAATAGPGLIGGVMAGLTAAKALALAADKPLVAVNHLEAHALTVRLTRGIGFPFLLLLASGGHCQLVAVEGVGRYRSFGTTIDDAVGEAFDKVAKLLGLPYPGGPAIEELAKCGDPGRHKLPRPMLGRDNADFSFAGLKTAVRHIVRGGNFDSPADLAASFQRAVVEVVVDRTTVAMRRYRDETAPVNCGFVMAGGVAANRALRDGLAELCNRENFACTVPPPALCTDNAAMVAWAGVERSTLGLFDELSAAPRARWQLRDIAAGVDSDVPNELHQ